MYCHNKKTDLKKLSLQNLMNLNKIEDYFMSLRMHACQSSFLLLLLSFNDESGLCHLLLNGSVKYFILHFFGPLFNKEFSLIDKFFIGFKNIVWINTFVILKNFIWHLAIIITFVLLFSSDLNKCLHKVFKVRSQFKELLGNFSWHSLKSRGILRLSK